MQKSKTFNLAVITGIILYFLFSQFYLSNLGNTFTYMINPLFFATVALIVKILIPPAYKTDRFKKDIIQYVLIFMFVYSLLYLLSGVLTNFGVNPYAKNIRGLIFNLYSVWGVMFFQEYIRYKLINNVFNKDVWLMSILLVITFSFQDIKIIGIINSINIYFMFKTIFYTIVPTIIKNALFTYIELHIDYIPVVIYQAIALLLLWIPPVLPKSPWVLEAIINSLFPLILLLYCRYHIESKSRFRLNNVVGAINPSGIVPLTVGLVMVIWFALGIFPIRPIGVATGSMEPTIHVGDLVLIKKCTPNDVEKGDIIQYQLEGYTVIHRATNIYQKDGEYFFVTKGDNNDNEDMLPVRENQLLGKVIYRVPYIALPTIWLNHLSSQEVLVDVETGS